MITIGNFDDRAVFLILNEKENSFFINRHICTILDGFIPHLQSFGYGEMNVNLSE